MRHVLHALHVLLETAAGVEPGNLASRRHDGLDVAVGKRQHALDHLALLAPEALVNDAVLGRLVVIPARLARHQAHDGVRRALAERHAVEVPRGVARGKLVEELDEDREGDRGVEVGPSGGGSRGPSAMRLQPIISRNERQSTTTVG